MSTSIRWAPVRAGVLGGIATASGIALTATSGWLIVRAAEKPVILTLLAAIVAVRAFGMARPAFRYWERLVSHDAALDRLATARTETFSALVPLTPARLGRRRRSDVLTAVVHDLTDEVEAETRVTVPILSSALAGLMAIVLGAAFSPAVGLVLLGLAVAVVLISLVTLRVESASLPRLLAARAEVNRVSELVTTQADELRAVGAWPTAQAWLEDAHVDLEVATRRGSRGRAFAAGAFLVVTAVATVAVAAITTGLAVGGPVQALLVLVPVALADAIAPLADTMRAKAQASEAARRTHALLAQDPAVVDPAAAGPAAVDSAAPLEPARAGLRLTGVTASWHPDEPIAVGPTDLDLPAGARVAVTGPNGCGKSTLLAVLARHLDPHAGTYTAIPTGDASAADSTSTDSTSTDSVATVDVLTEPLAQARGRIAIADDDPHVFATSVRGNLLLARPDASDDQVTDALTRAGLGRWLAGLPEGLDTPLGTGGRGISGGERARLAIARTVVSRRPVILLDEPVAHLDPPTARAVLADLLEHRDEIPESDRPAVLLVTHRTEGLDHVDAVVEIPRTHR